ncbi:MAG: hypothetical protein ACT4OO_06890 [Nitrospiraceae bacterium]
MTATMTGVQTFLTLFVSLILVPFPLLAEEPVSIQNVLAEPDSFHLRQITLEGTVREVQPLAPYTAPSGAMCYGAYLFRLEDETGSLPVAVLGVCGVPILRDPDVADDDRVMVRAAIQAPGHGGYFLTLSGLRVSTQDRGELQAVAVTISRSEQ